MISYIILFFLLLCSDNDYIVLDGWLSQYSQTPTDATIEYRKSVGQMPEDFPAQGDGIIPYSGVVAVEDCYHIGKDAYLYAVGNWHRVLVFDCLGRDVEPNWMEENNIIAEMGYYLTRDLNLVGQGGIKARLVIIGGKEE